MNESTNQIDRFIKRAQIRPELAAREDIVESARAIQSLLHGGDEQYLGKNWTIRRFGVGQTLYLKYQGINSSEANFLFDMKDTKDVVTLMNFDREAKFGAGVTAFAEFEHMASALAFMEDRPVQVAFLLFSQPDTEKLLLRRGYEYSRIKIGNDFMDAMERVFSANSS